MTERELIFFFLKKKSTVEMREADWLGTEGMHKHIPVSLKSLQITPDT